MSGDAGRKKVAIPFATHDPADLVGDVAREIFTISDNHHPGIGLVAKHPRRQTDGAQKSLEMPGREVNNGAAKIAGI